MTPSGFPSALAPSRYHLALSRLYVVIRLSLRPPAPAPHPVLYSFHPGQSAAEVYGASLIENLLMTLLLVGWVDHVHPLHWWELVLLAVPMLITSYSIQQMLYLPISLIMKRWGNPERTDNHRLNSFSDKFMLTLGAAAAAVAGGWIRWVGLFWLALVLLDLIAWILLLLFRGQVKRIERQFGGGAQSGMPF